MLCDITLFLNVGNNSCSLSSILTKVLSIFAVSGVVITSYFKMGFFNHAVYHHRDILCVRESESMCE